MTAPAAPATDSAPADVQETPTGKTYSEDYVKNLRDEAAKARVAKNDAVAAAKAVLTDQHASALAELQAAHEAALSEVTEAKSISETALLKLKAVLQAGVASDSVLDVADLVQGSDEATISESVQRVTALLGKAPARVPAVDTTHGTGGHAMPLNGDPVLKALKAAVGMK